MAETIPPAALFALASTTNELTFTIVPEGSGRRIALDRDTDGFLDRDELDFPSDPANAASIPLHTVARITQAGNLVTISWNSVSGKTYQVQFNDAVGLAAWTNLQSSILATNGTSSVGASNNAASQFYRIQLLP